MTDAEKFIARAIAPSLVAYYPGSSTKRFATDVSGWVKYQPEKVLTPKQARYLCQVAVKYRRQIAPDVVAAARRILAELDGAAA